MITRICFAFGVGFLLLAAGFSGGCATYVNIPSQTGDVAVDNPNDGSVRAVSIKAARAVIARGSTGQVYQLVLPEGTSSKNYVRVADAVGASVQISPGQSLGLPVLDVRQVFIRGTSAQVDVIEPAGETGRQLVTVYLDWGLFSGWQAQRVRLWSMDVEKALLASRPYGPIPRD